MATELLFHRFVIKYTHIFLLLHVRITVSKVSPIMHTCTHKSESGGRQTVGERAGTKQK